MTEIPGEVNGLDTIVAHHQLLQHLPAVVPTAIVDKKQLEISVYSGNRRRQLLVETLQDLFFVEDGNYDGI